MTAVISEKPPSLTQRTVSGAAWSSAGRIAVQTVTIGVMMVVARTLTPRAYGLFGMARLAIGFIEIFRDLGTTSAIIQRKQVTEELLSSVFWANLILGLLAALVTAAGAPYVARFYHEPGLTPIVRVLACGFVLMSAGAVPAALLNREMAFKRIVLIELAAAVLAAVITIAAVLSGAGVWSLVISVLVTAAVSTALFWPASRWRPKWVLDWREIRSIASYSLNLSGFSVVNYFNRNADNAIVGRYLGAVQLGYYQLAYNIMLYAVQNISVVLGRVMFPAFAKVQDDNARFQQAYVKGVSMIAAITFPLMMGIMVLAAPLEGAIFGMKWKPVVPLLVILAPVGLIQSVASTVGYIYVAKGRTDWLFRWGLAATLLVVGSFFAGLPWGNKGVASAYLIANLLLIYPALAIPFRLIDLKLSVFLRPLQAVFACSLLMMAAMWAAASQIQGWNPAIQLAVLVPLGTGIYFSIMLWTRPAAAVHLLALRRRVDTVSCS